MAEAQMALQLDPSLAEAHAALAVIAYLEHRWVDSENEFQHAFRLNPNYAVGYHWHAHLLAGQGLLDKALAALERSVALDPLSFVTLVIYASQLNFALRYEDVLTITDRALALRSTVIAPLYSARAMALLALGRREEAAAATRTVFQEGSWWMRWWGDEETLYVLYQVGESEEAAAVWRQWQAMLALSGGKVFGASKHTLVLLCHLGEIGRGPGHLVLQRAAGENRHFLSSRPCDRTKLPI
jgi:tetratricopeptide (TPR) repeat protein